MGAILFFSIWLACGAAGSFMIERSASQFGKYEVLDDWPTKAYFMSLALFGPFALVGGAFILLVAVIADGRKP